jgi:uncharacterized protein (TIGR02145 family)
MQHSTAHNETKGSFTDPRDGKVYKTVKIGEQTWFAENLNYEAEGSVCYKNNPKYGAKYGRLYNWETAMKVCPEGWHLPTNEEWDKLYRFVDGDKGTESPYESKTAGKYLKAKSSWNKKLLFIVSGNGTDEFGFSALPGGNGDSRGNFKQVGYCGFWWSASEDENNSDGAYFRLWDYFLDNAYWTINFKSFLFSVRCIKD